MEIAFILIPIAIIVAIVFRMAAGSMDHDRVREYVELRGGKVIDASWDPLGPGWFGEKSDRIYMVRYIDQDGNEHEAYCKTSMFTGVYFTEDRIVKHAPRLEQTKEESLEEENRRLREELDRLKRKQNDKDQGAIKEP